MNICSYVITFVSVCQGENEKSRKFAALIFCNEMFDGGIQMINFLLEKFGVYEQ